MRRISLVAFLFFLSVLSQAQNAPRAEVERFWVDFDVYRGEKKGVLIHLKMTVYNMKGRDTSVRVRFFQDDMKEENLLIDRDGSYRDRNGKVAAFRRLKIDYNPGYYEDLQVFVPYEQLDLSQFPGKYRLKMDVDLVYTDTEELIQHLTFYDVEYNEPAIAPVDRVWVDYNVTKNGVVGMVVHTKFRVIGFKDTDASLRVLVFFDDNNPVKGNSARYRASNGQLVVYVPIKPCCTVTDYDDLSVFIPYSEFSLSPGEYKLKLDIDLIYPDDTLIQHMAFHDFIFTKRW
ncbi:MAG: hypothetical protein N2Z23_01235 [Pyrinomonadaceae bacterium]|nr:hypothetical protein [Pyrinomonadaceae bacterium]MCX7639055.1 hypothetical protein [Pyrinomonadaceae bacterium]MDW8303724.1 hypothetical protein [Acidobacteriota bacterium]